MAYDAEKQMLREFFLLIAPRTNCYFCGKPLIARKEDLTFGHRRHTRIWELNFTTHHDDENRDNNEDSNLKPSHSNCHKKHHREKRNDRNSNSNTSEETSSSSNLSGSQAISEGR